jgi:hypothetical protein
MLHHPIYAGAYRHGHRPTDPRRKKPGRPGTGRGIRKPDECEVLIRDHLPAYITWERFEANQRQLESNRMRAASKGPALNGQSLLVGILHCGICDRRMTVSYDKPTSRMSYACHRGVSDYGDPPCQSLSGQRLDEFVAEQIIEAMHPAAIEASVLAMQQIESDRKELTKNWQQRIERARYEADRAARQYHAVEPENRLVARELERLWEQAIAQVKKLEQEFARFQHATPPTLSAEQRQQLRQLASDVPSVWHDENTSYADRKQIARMILERVVVTTARDSDRFAVTLHWAGGLIQEHQLVRPVNTYKQLADYPKLVERIASLKQQDFSAEAIAQQLNTEGFHPPKRCNSFSASMVQRLLGRCSLKNATSPSRDLPLGPDEWTLAGLAGRLTMSKETMHSWRKLGWVHSRKLEGPMGRWILWADAEELARLQQLRNCPRTWENKPQLAELTVPKPRPTA